LAASLSQEALAEAAQNVRLVGYNDLQGRTALMVTTKSDAANGNWVYVGHHESFTDGKPLLNPITGKMEYNGTSILDVTNPKRPTYLAHIPGEPGKARRIAPGQTRDRERPAPVGPALGEGFGQRVPDSRAEPVAFAEVEVVVRADVHGRGNHRVRDRRHRRNVVRSWGGLSSAWLH